MRPHREVARAAREDCVVGQPFAEDRHDAGQVELAGKLSSRERRPVLGMRPLERGRAPGSVERLELGERLGERGPRRDDRERRLVDPAELVGIGMDVDQHAPDARRDDRREAAGLDVAEPGPDDEEDVGVAQAVAQRRIGAEAEMARVAGRLVVHVVLAAPRSRDGDAARGAPRGERRPRGGAPGKPSDDREWPLRAGEQLACAREIARRRAGLRRRVR